MATGLPVILSDIVQHKEIFSVNKEIGFLYRQNDATDFVNSMKKMYAGDVKKAGIAAYDSAHENFSAKKMSERYQKIYQSMVEKS